MKKEEARRKALELGLDHEDEATAGAGRWHRLGLVAACRAATKRARRLWVGADPTLKDCRLAESRSERLATPAATCYPLPPSS